MGIAPFPRRHISTRISLGHAVQTQPHRAVLLLHTHTHICKPKGDPPRLSCLPEACLVLQWAALPVAGQKQISKSSAPLLNPQTHYHHFFCHRLHISSCLALHPDVYPSVSICDVMPNHIHLLAGCDTADNAFTQYICTDKRIRARVETDVQYLSEGVIKHAKLILVCMHM